MANFSVKFSYTLNEVIYHKSAIIRATTPDSAKEKISKFCLNHVDGQITSFVFDSVSVSSINFILL